MDATHTHTGAHTVSPASQSGNSRQLSGQRLSGCVCVGGGGIQSLSLHRCTHTHTSPSWQRVLHCSVSLLADVAVGSDTNKLLSCHSWVLVVVVDRKSVV